MINRKETSITVSEEYGVNPSVACCEVCGKEHSVALLGTSYKENGKTAKAPMKILSGLCPDCANVINQGGCMLIEIKDGEGDNKNPYRTGRIIGVNKACKERLNVGNSICYITETDFNNLFGKYFNKQ